jgi:hypothetical protein
MAQVEANERTTDQFDEHFILHVEETQLDRAYEK